MGYKGRGRLDSTIAATCASKPPGAACWRSPAGSRSPQRARSPSFNGDRSPSGSNSVRSRPVSVCPPRLHRHVYTDTREQARVLRFVPKRSTLIMCCDLGCQKSNLCWPRYPLYRSGSRRVISPSAGTDDEGRPTRTAPARQGSTNTKATFKLETAYV